LYDNIKATKEKYGAIMQSSPDGQNPASTEASEMVSQLEDAGEARSMGRAKKNKKKHRATMTEEGELFISRTGRC
jgi:predicted transcriptional regulator